MEDINEYEKNEDIASEEEDTEADAVTEDEGTESREVNAEDDTTGTPTGGNADIDYEELMREDLAAIKGEFPEAGMISHITELDNPLRYAALRDLGLSPVEAYLATQRRHTAYNNRSHLKSSYPGAAGVDNGSMSAEALHSAREIFSGLSDREIQKLYKKVTR